MTTGDSADRASADEETRGIRKEIEACAPARIPEYVTTVRASDAKRVKTCVRTFAGPKRRAEVHDYLLSGSLLRRARWESAAWKDLRAAMHRPTPDRLPFHWLLREFYAVIQNVQHHNEVDRVEMERQRRARAALPKRRWLERT